MYIGPENLWDAVSSFFIRFAMSEELRNLLKQPSGHFERVVQVSWENVKTQNAILKSVLLFKGSTRQKSGSPEGLNYSQVILIIWINHK